MKLHSLTNPTNPPETMIQGEVLYRALCELTSDYVYYSRRINSDHFQIAWISDNFFSDYGFTSLADLEANGGWQGIFHPEDLPVVLRDQREIIAGQKVEQELRLITSQNEVRWVRFKHRQDWDENHQYVTGLLSAAQDITERKMNELRKQVQLAVSQLLAEAAAVEPTLNNILQTIGEHLGWQIGQWWQLDEATNKLFCASNWHEDNQPTTAFDTISQETRYAVGEGLPGRIWQEAIPGWSNEFNEPASFVEQQSNVAQCLQSAFGLPILLEDKVLGVMVFYSRYNYAPDGELLELLKDLGNRIGQFVERKRTEKELSEKQIHYQTLIESLQIGVMVQGPQSEILLANNAACELLGLTLAELMDKSTSDPGWNIIQEDGSDFPAHSRPIHQALSSRKPVRNVIIGVWKPKSNDRIWLLQSAVPELGTNGEVRQVICTLIDVTMHRQALEALQNSRASFQAILDNAPFSIFMKDTEGYYSLFNHRCELATGRLMAEVVGKTDYDLVSKEIADHWKSHDDEVLACGHALEWEEIAPITAGAGAPIEITTKFPLLGVNGKPYGIVGIIRDVTVRRRAEEALAAERERLAVTLASIADGVITTDITGKIKLINQVGQELSGWFESEAIEQPLSEVFKLYDNTSGQLIPDPVAQCLASNQTVQLAPSTLYSILISRDGTERQVAGTSAPIRNSNEEIIGIVLVLRDVAEKQKVIASRMRATKLESLGLLAGGIAHDFNNILTGIAGNISLARLGAAEGSYQADYLISLDEAERACLAAKELTQQLLTFAKGGAPVKKTASLTQIIQESTQFVLRGSKVQSEYSIPADLWPVQVDPGQISQVVHNMIINAIQAMPGGGKLAISAENINLSYGQTLTSSSLKAGRYVRLTIQDWGEGISPENLLRIFDPYFTTKESGNGLGLAVCYSIIKKHDGHLEVFSELGTGTIFLIYLPALSVNLPPPKADQKNLLEISPRYKGEGRILVMDDESTIRRVINRLLTRLGYQVDEATEGLEAVKLYQQAQEAGQPYSVIIMDLTIPGGMGGKDAIQRLLDIDPQARVIVSSGYANDPMMAHYRDYGFKGLVTKPYRLEDLSRVIKEVIQANPIK